MSKFIVTSDGGQDRFAPIEKSSLLDVDRIVKWSNGETWQAPYTNDELQNIYDGVMYDENDNEIKLLKGCKRTGMKDVLRNQIFAWLRGRKG